MQLIRLKGYHSIGAARSQVGKDWPTAALLASWPERLPACPLVRCSNFVCPTFWAGWMTFRSLAVFCTMAQCWIKLWYISSLHLRCGRSLLICKALRLPSLRQWLKFSQCWVKVKDTVGANRTTALTAAVSANLLQEASGLGGRSSQDSTQIRPGQTRTGYANTKTDYLPQICPLP